jgi:hypothetical protein
MRDVGLLLLLIICLLVFDGCKKTYHHAHARHPAYLNHSPCWMEEAQLEEDKAADAPKKGHCPGAVN